MVLLLVLLRSRAAAPHTGESSASSICLTPEGPNHFRLLSQFPSRRIFRR